MSRKVVFTVPGIPQGKGRPRSTKSGHHYTPAKTANYEKLVKTLAVSAMEMPDLFIGPVKISINAYFQVPKSWSKTKKLIALDGDILPTSKPDWDNIGKIVCDALNGIVYKDDIQIFEGIVRKFYAANAGVKITIEEI